MGFLCVFCLHDTGDQYLALSEGFTCFFMCSVAVVLRCLRTVHVIEIWTLLAEDSRRLQSFHMSCQRQILGVRWNDHVRNSDVAVQTGLPNVIETIIKRRHVLFGHVARLDATTPAHQILKQVIAVKSGYQPDAVWRRAPGRPRNS